MGEFNLIDNDWIPCFDTFGSVRDYSLRTVLHQARNISEMRDPSPIVSLSLHRLLLAILHRALQGPRTLLEWERCFNNGWHEKTTAYLGDKDIYHRFFLLDDTRPFLQESKLELKPEYRQSVSDSKYCADSIPLSSIARELSASRNPTLFDHTIDSPPVEFTHAQAARLVVAAQFYAMPDGSGYVTSPVTYGQNVFVRGDNLFETLMYNLLIYNDRRPVPSDLKEDKPSWERDDSRKEDSIPTGYLEYLTWPYRRLRLISDNSLTYVLRNKYAPGINKEWQKDNPDPMLFYKMSEKSGYQPVRLLEERALWRDSFVLMGLVRDRYTHEPDFVNQLARLGSPEKVLQALGTCSSQNKIFFWRHESLPLPSCLLTEVEALEVVRRALQCANAVAKSLRVAVYFLVMQLMSPISNTKEKEADIASDFTERNDRNPKKKKDPIGDLYKSLKPERLYWQKLENPFSNFIQRIPEDKTLNKNHCVVYGCGCFPEWVNDVRVAAWDSFLVACDGIAESSEALKARARAEGRFNKNLNSILKFYSESLEEGGDDV